MTRLALLSNPYSQQNRRGLAAIEEAARGHGIVHRRLEDFAELGAALAELEALGTELLIVAGGDGTVQAVLTELLERRPAGHRPKLALLPRGMTNMTAADVGLRGRPERALARLSELAAQGRLERAETGRHVLRLENIPGMTPQRGMFFGSGAITRAITYCRSKVHPFGIEADWAAALTLVGLLAGRLVGRSGDQVLAGHLVTTAFDNEREVTSTDLLALATTLDRLVLGSRPFWNQGGGPLRYTAIAYPPEGLLRRAPRVLYGGEDRRLPAGYKSRGIRRLHLTLDGPFTLDGELFDPPRDRPLVLSADERVDFVRF